MDFNSRPRVGGDGGNQRGPDQLAISIHAPAWGATVPGRDGEEAQDISIHAPAWGATAGKLTTENWNQLFQFTPPRGGRPTGGTRIAAVMYFNSRPRVGGDRFPEHT